MENVENVELQPEVETLMRKMRAATTPPAEADFSGRRKWEEKLKLAQWIAERKAKQTA